MHEAMESSKFQDALAGAQVDALYSTTLASALMNWLGSMVVATAFTGSARPIGLAFVAVTTTLLLCRTALLQAYRHKRGVGTINWAWVASAYTLASGIAWGSVVCWAAHRGSEPQLLVATCIAMGAVMMTITNISFWPAVVSFQVPVIGIAAVGYLTSGNPGHLQIGAAAAILCLVTAVAVRKLGGTVLRSIRLAVENDHLAQDLRTQADALETANRELEALSRTDGLTGLANRRWFDSMLAHEWERAARMGTTLALLAIDVDDFKRYNDQYGHSAGDECLKAVARALEGNARSGMDLVARPGGEEFALLLPVTGLDEATDIAERVRLAVAEATQSPAFALPRPATVSIGVASAMPSEGGTPSAILDEADRALYRAKTAGRNRVSREGAA